MKKYKIDHYDHFFQAGHDLKGCFLFETFDEVKNFVKLHQEAKRKWPSTFILSEYVLTIWDGNKYVKAVQTPRCIHCETKLESHELYLGNIVSWVCPTCKEIEYDPFAKVKHNSIIGGY